MSVRIYQLSKEIGMDNADLITLLRDRGYEVKSASSTIDNISAESLREEFGTVEGGAESSDLLQLRTIQLRIRLKRMSLRRVQPRY
ncbi:MAG: translation initiation factor IF-2 N-terminal domain-containing protein [Verrucomicrobia bacterium]|nr:translation initiation factor IF-2 N-terminal domain-containing protein [Verrucomicrobiota bacterium]